MPCIDDQKRHILSLLVPSVMHTLFQYIQYNQKMCQWKYLFYSFVQFCVYLFN